VKKRIILESSRNCENGPLKVMLNIIIKTLKVMLNIIIKTLKVMLNIGNSNKGRRRMANKKTPTQTEQKNNVN
jgi:hypothetical protein